MGPSFSAAQPRRRDRAPPYASLSSPLDDIVFNPANRATCFPRRNTRILCAAASRPQRLYTDDSPACQTTLEKTSGCPPSCCCLPWQRQMMPSSTFLRACSVLRLSYGKDGASEIRFVSSVEAFASSSDR